MTERLARLHHNSDELRHVAKLLDALNEDHDFAGIDPEAKIDFYWADVKMGTIMTPDGAGQFAYFPVAEYGEPHDKDALRTVPPSRMDLHRRARQDEESPPANA